MAHWPFREMIQSFRDAMAPREKGCILSWNFSVSASWPPGGDPLHPASPCHYEPTETMSQNKTFLVLAVSQESCQRTEIMVITSKLDVMAENLSICQNLQGNLKMCDKFNRYPCQTIPLVTGHLFCGQSLW